MADNSAIEWTGATWSPVYGCTRVDPACAHCYIERQTPLRVRKMRFAQVDEESTTGIELRPEALNPAKVRKLKPLDKPIFVCSLSDLFHEEVPDRFIAEVFGVMALAGERTFQVLTKRVERMRDLLRSPKWWMCVEGSAQRMHFEATGEDTSLTMAVHGPLPNVWLGTTIANARYTWRADALREIPAAIRFISAEPLLGSLLTLRKPLTLPPLLDERNVAAPLDLTGMDWLIVGGESGGRFARPMHPEWARELRDACLNLDPLSPLNDYRRPFFFFKQWGSWAPLAEDDPTTLFSSSGTWASKHEGFRYAGSSPKSGGRLLDGREWSEMPVREAVVA